MMTVQDILKLTDPKNQNLPQITADTDSKKCDILFVPVFEETAATLTKTYPELKKLKLAGSKKESHILVVKGQLWKIQGMGKKKDMSARRLQRKFGSMYLEAENMKIKRIGIMCLELDWAYFGATAIHVAALNPNLFKPKKRQPAPTVFLINKQFKAQAAEVKKQIQRGQVMAEAKNLMRVLGACPPNALNTDTYSQIIMSLCKKWGVNCKNIPKKDLVKYELLNAVSLGSSHDSKLLMITMPVKGSKASALVVGKGLCYDSGGIQGKGDHMKCMKEDMAGSASLLGTILNIVKNKLKLKETTYFLLPLAENMMGERANRADDIWTAGDGQTVEIHHTDAEGRLVMGDAICYAKNNVKEKIDKVFTIATLTGSCAAALGDLYTGSLCSDGTLREEVVKAGEKSGDLVFPGPWDMDYDDNNSPVADVANLAETKQAGWIKAGLYLARFVPKDKKTGELTAKFCHFDIAGSIDMYAKGSKYRRKGFSSGVGVGYLSLLLTK